MSCHVTSCTTLWHSGLLAGFFISDLFWPEDAAYILPVKGNDPIHITFYYMPAFWAIKEYRFDIAVINSDLCFQVILLWLPERLEPCKYSVCLPEPGTDVLYCCIVLTGQPAKEGEVLDLVKWIIVMGECGLAFMHITGLGKVLIFMLVCLAKVFMLSVSSCRWHVFEDREARSSAKSRS